MEQARSLPEQSARDSLELLKNLEGALACYQDALNGYGYVYEFNFEGTTRNYFWIDEDPYEDTDDWDDAFRAAWHNAWTIAVKNGFPSDESLETFVIFEAAGHPIDEDTAEERVSELSSATDTLRSLLVEQGVLEPEDDLSEAHRNVPRDVDDGYPFLF